MMEEWKNYFYQEFWLIYQLKVNELLIYGNTTFDNVESKTILVYIDNIWIEYLEKTSLLREAVGWRGYGQQNPLTEYKREAYDLFSKQIEVLPHYLVYELFRALIV